MRDVLDDTVIDGVHTSHLNNIRQKHTAGRKTEKHSRIHSSHEQDLIFVVHGHHNEQFRLPSIEIRPQRVLGPHKVVWVARRGSVTHFGHFLARARGLGHEMRGDVHVQYEIPLE
jgi:hypothetical protein